MSEIVKPLFKSLDQHSFNGLIEFSRKKNKLAFLLAKIPKVRGGLFPTAIAPKIVLRNKVQM